LLWFSEYHHSLHTLWFAIIVTFLGFFISGRKWLAAAMTFVAFHLHLLEDLAGSRGPDGYAWPIPYLFPFSDKWTWIWQGQWRLNGWPNIAITVALLLTTIGLAASRGFSPVEMFSRRADNAVVAALRNRLGIFGRTA
jgi:inner membrane protein